MLTRPAIDIIGIECSVWPAAAKLMHWHHHLSDFFSLASGLPTHIHLFCINPQSFLYDLVFVYCFLGGRRDLLYRPMFVKNNFSPVIYIDNITLCWSWLIPAMSHRLFLVPWCRKQNRFENLMSELPRKPVTFSVSGDAIYLKLRGICKSKTRYENMADHWTSNDTQISTTLTRVTTIRRADKETRWILGNEILMTLPIKEELRQHSTAR